MAGADYILAPLRGITDRVYREAHARCFGSFDRALAPFVKLRKDKLLLPAEHTQLALDDNPLLKTIPQVHTNHGPSFLSGLKQLHDLGYDEVNWNLGCPYPMVAKRQRGAGLLPYPDRIERILNEVVGNSEVTLSVKIRLGYHNPDDVWPVMDVLNQFPLTEVILHPRTADQMYGGEVDLDRAASVFKACKHPFVYNGDIMSVDSFKRIKQHIHEPSGWMIGRGALMNPFLPGLLNGNSGVDPKSLGEAFWNFHSHLRDGYMTTMDNPGNVVIKLKAHWQYLAHCFEDTPATYKQVKRCRKLDEYDMFINGIREAPVVIENG